MDNSYAFNKRLHLGLMEFVFPVSSLKRVVITIITSLAEFKY